MPHIVTIGAEVEGYLSNRRGELLSTLSVLEGGRTTTGHKFEGIGCDVAFCSFEMRTMPVFTAIALGVSLDACRELFPAGVVLNFKPRTPYQGPIPIAQKPRYAVMERALTREHPEGFNGMEKVAPWNATHFHIGVESLYEPESILLLNLLNNIAPFAWRATVERYRVRNAEGHLSVWNGWSQVPGRVPAPRWFASFEHLTEFVSAIPKLMVERNGVWFVGDGELSHMGDPASEGVLWWLARPRAVFDPPTIEWRSFPSLEPTRVVELGGEIITLVQAFREYNQLHLCDGLRNSASTTDLYQALSRKSWLVPKEQLTDEVWWKMYGG